MIIFPLLSGVTVQQTNTCSNSTIETQEKGREICSKLTRNARMTSQKSFQCRFQLVENVLCFIDKPNKAKNKPIELSDSINMKGLCESKIISFAFCIDFYFWQFKFYILNKSNIGFPCCLRLSRNMITFPPFNWSYYPVKQILSQNQQQKRA